MKHRVCIIIDEKIYKKTRDVQAFLIKETSRNVSFSKVISEILEVGLTNHKKYSDIIKIIIEEKKLE